MKKTELQVSPPTPGKGLNFFDTEQKEHLLCLRTHPRVLLEFEVARHSQSPLHQRYLSEEHSLTSSFIVKKNNCYQLFNAKFSFAVQADPVFSNPLPSGHSVQEAAR